VAGQTIQSACRQPGEADAELQRDVRQTRKLHQLPKGEFERLFPKAVKLSKAESKARF
jgi:hypothetical protein